MFHDYYHLVDKTGKNKKKVELFNIGEELRMNMTKRMFNILVDEKVYDVNDDNDLEKVEDVLRADDDDNDENQKRTDKPRSLDGATLTEFRKRVKVVPVSDEEEEVEDETDPTDYEELKAHLKTMTEDERIKHRNFETLRNTANGNRPDYRMEKIYRAIKELTKEEMEEDNMTDPYDYMSPKSKAQYDRDMERRAKEAEEEEKQEKRGQKCINKKPNKNTPQNK